MTSTHAGQAFLDAPPPPQPDARASAVIFAEAMHQSVQSVRWLASLISSMGRLYSKPPKDPAWQADAEELASKLFTPLSINMGIPVEAVTQAFEGRDFSKNTGRIPITNMSVLASCLSGMRDARPVTFVDHAQVDAICRAPLPEDFPMAALRLPFPNVFLDFRGLLPAVVMTRTARENTYGGGGSGGFIPFQAGEATLALHPRAVLLQELDTPAHSVVQPQLGWQEADRGRYRLKFEGTGTRTSKPDEDRHGLLAHVFADIEDFNGQTKDPRFFGATRLQAGPNMFIHWGLGWTWQQGARGFVHEDMDFWGMVARLILFLNSPAVEDGGPDVRGTSIYLRRTAEDSGRALDPTVRVMRVRLPRHMRHGSASQPEAGARAPYAYRFDVRGHFKHFRRGPMTGRVIWCPAFVKGKPDRPYRPTLRVLDKEEA